MWCKTSTAGKGKVPFTVLTQERIDSLTRDKQQVLGEGASCRVLLVEVDGAPCCLKVAKEKRLKRLFQKEFDILLELNGAAGAPLALGTSFGFPALLTSFCGKSTFCELSRVASGDKEKFSAFLSLVKDVQQLHTFRYTHNDIKENNVVVRRDPDGRLQVSLIDYGMAKPFGTKLKYAGNDRHNPSRHPWMAPELKSGGACQPPVDMYSLGFVLKNLLATCEARYPSLEVLAATAMSPDPADRPSVAKMAKSMREYTVQDKKTKKSVFGKILRFFSFRK
uniref:Protein kinase domain-containing protein n=1 Tax=Scylla olivacea TaxID=85551 RepID=A0A0P4WG04_SCYOL